MQEARTAWSAGASGTPLTPSKIFAVHLNYRSRAQQRGRVPSEPSYFLKPPSSVAADGDPVVRPRDCELLAFEGEIALVIGARTRGVSPEEGLRRISHYTVGNDFGVYDLRWADRGSNVFAKGHDTFTPLGPRLVPADELDPGALTLRTFVNGELAQEDSTANLLFGFGQLVADLSRFITLEPGDVILTGTPAGSRPVAPGDLVEVEVPGIGRLRNEIVEAPSDTQPYGAMPRVTPEVRSAALGTRAPVRPFPLSDRAKAALRRVSTATLSTQLRRRGIANTFMAGLRPTRPDVRLLGYAHTLRYVPLREDVLAADTAELNAQKRAVEEISEDEVLVIEARGETGSGTIGDILALRALRRGATGIVTDGGLRDSPAVAELEIPTYYKAPHAAVLGLLHYPLETGVPVACAGVLVMPGDVLVGDAEGVLVLPAALAEEVALHALEQERREAWALERVDEGESIRGVYPLSDERRAEYEAWSRKHRKGDSDQ
jgi:2-keto-4-pentenoate hydratase/2-oxohepta-3-ene-1,7-dioic acid hydratase in catechol pathway/regulator of RNase E activity RraA